MGHGQVAHTMVSTPPPCCGRIGLKLSPPWCCSSGARWRWVPHHACRLARLRLAAVPGPVGMTRPGPYRCALSDPPRFLGHAVLPLSPARPLVPHGVLVAAVISDRRAATASSQPDQDIPVIELPSPSCLLSQPASQRGASIPGRQRAGICSPGPTTPSRKRT